MTSVTDPPEVVECRERVEAHIASGELAAAEALLRTAAAAWPERLGFRLRLARVLEWQGRFDEARVSIEELVCERRDLPKWTRETIAHFGFAIASGVRLDIRSDAVNEPMKKAFTWGKYEQHEAEFLSSVLRPGDSLLEVGGGLGFIATFAKLQEPSTTVVSFEANPSLMPMVERTKQLNGVDFDMRNAMLGEHAGTSDFFVNRAFWASSASHDYGGASIIQVPVVPVSQVMAERRFNVLMMDIEGGEIDLVPLMDLQHVDRFVIETHPRLTGEKSVKKMLRDIKSNYGLVSVREQSGVHLLARD